MAELESVVSQRWEINGMRPLHIPSPLGQACRPNGLVHILFCRHPSKYRNRYSTDTHVDKLDLFDFSLQIHSVLMVLEVCF